MATSRTPAQGSDEPSGTENGLPDDEPMAQDDPAQDAQAEDGEGPALAEPGQRLLARIVDTLIVGLPIIIVVKEFVSGHELDIVAPPVVAGCMLLYEAVQLALWGRTLGKRFAGIQVVPDPSSLEDAATGAEETETASSASGLPHASYGRPNVPRAVLRAAVYAVPIALRPVHIVGLLAGLFWVANAGFIYEGTRRQALHDRLAGTVVVKRRTP
ncbi:RDD family protein [Actinomadura opuntiae]|uniref:RDD family protein n=1 Tax=Actinomadura sp. OS1-43 TaxID=604315 RepID=UPI00255AEF44|nr:RDD family protein [Actinomadura sp. OS1-43]MDL4813834.1 RDD family protein [Actinomadura sp. OS1-43]